MWIYILLALIPAGLGIWAIVTTPKRRAKAKEDGTLKEKEKKGAIIGVVAISITILVAIIIVMFL